MGSTRRRAFTCRDTCRLSDVNPFDYLTELQRNRRELFRSPAEWMPWNYRNTLERGGVASREGSGLSSTLCVKTKEC